MHFALDISDLDLQGLQLLEYEEEEDDVNALIADVCEYLADIGGVTFRVSGFGQNPWPVDVRTDLAVFLEQLPYAISAIERSDPNFVIDFYEQGIERTLVFVRDESEFTVECISATDWVPLPTKESISAEELRSMFVWIRESFFTLVGTVAPGLTQHPSLLDWGGLPGLDFQGV
jgi:hypothetical protein